MSSRHCPKLPRSKEVETFVEEVLRYEYQLEQKVVALVGGTVSPSLILEQYAEIGVSGDGNDGTKRGWLRCPKDLLSDNSDEFDALYKALSEDQKAVVDIVCSDRLGFRLAPVQLDLVAINPPNYNVLGRPSRGCLIEQRTWIKWTQYHDREQYKILLTLAKERNIQQIIVSSWELGSKLLESVARDWRKK